MKIKSRECTCAVDVQDLVTQWIFQLSMQNQIRSGDAEKSSKILTPGGKHQDPFARTNIVFFEVCEELNRHPERSTPRRSDTNRMAERAARRVKEATWQESWRAEVNQRHCYLRTVQDVLADGRRFINDGSIHLSMGRTFHLEQKISSVPTHRETKVECISSAQSPLSLPPPPLLLESPLDTR